MGPATLTDPMVLYTCQLGGEMGLHGKSSLQPTAGDKSSQPAIFSMPIGTCSNLVGPPERFSFGVDTQLVYVQHSIWAVGPTSLQSKPSIGWTNPENQEIVKLFFCMTRTMQIDRYSGEATVQERRSSNQESPNKWDPQDAATSAAVEGCFDCNICLDSARDPVVTFCGHMYCWSCIYKWLNQKTADGENQRPCPVCKVGLTQTMLVPLYGRWAGPLKKDQQESDGPHSPIPHRPSPLTQDPASANPIRPHHIHQDHDLYGQDRYRWAPRYVEEYRLSDTWAIRGTAVAVLPWVFGSRIQYSNPYCLVGPGNGDRRLRRAERSLSRISAFLVCCLIMCLLLF